MGPFGSCICNTNGLNMAINSPNICKINLVNTGDVDEGASMSDFDYKK